MWLYYCFDTSKEALCDSLVNILTNLRSHSDGVTWQLLMNEVGKPVPHILNHVVHPSIVQTHRSLFEIPVEMPNFSKDTQCQTLGKLNDAQNTPNITIKCKSFSP